MFHSKPNQNPSRNGTCTNVEAKQDAGAFAGIENALVGSDRTKFPYLGGMQ
tara:strand:- start:979 stop:1131 length:153 start_codon:yes stop_codon:yes gene_type:complete